MLLTPMMTINRLREIRDAGIDMYEYNLMKNGEKIEALEKAGLDPEDFVRRYCMGKAYFAEEEFRKFLT